MIYEINDNPIKMPSSCTWGLQDLSTEDSGRTLDGIMHKDIVAVKIKFDCVWNGPSKEEATAILQPVCNNAFVKLKFDDPVTGMIRTAMFYTGDKSGPVHMWTSNKKVFSTISFNFIEQ